MASNQPPIDDAAVAEADKEMEERANRAKELLSQRYRGLKAHQVSWSLVSRRCCKRKESLESLR